MSDEVKVVLDGEEVSREVIQEKKRELKNNERIVEITENNFETVERMRG